MATNSIRNQAILLVLLCLSGQALAQAVWIWTDTRGARQVSDRPPPADVPASRILKAPAGAGGAATNAAADAAPAAPAATDAPVKPPPTLADRNAEFNKRRAEQAAKDKQAGENAAELAERRANCERARRYSAVLESGERISQTDAKGERAFMDDAQRAREAGEMRKALAQCK